MIGRSKIFDLPDNLSIMFTGFFLLGLGSGGITTPALPEIVEQSITVFKDKRKKSG